MAIKKCYKDLFKKINLQNSETKMFQIIEKIWREKKNTPKIQIAYAISICEMLLNPNNLIIQVSEEIIKPKLARNHVSF